MKLDKELIIDNDNKVKIPPKYISFGFNDREVIRIEEDGNVFVRGNLIENDKEIYKAFKRFLIEAGAYIGEKE